MCAIIDLSN